MSRGVREEGVMCLTCNMVFSVLLPGDPSKDDVLRRHIDFVWDGHTQTVGIHILKRIAMVHGPSAAKF